MKRSQLLLVVGLAWLLGSSLAGGQVLEEPPEDKIYLAAFPDFGGWEDEVDCCRIAAYEGLAGRPIAWAYFSDNWVDGIRFPFEAVRAIHDAGRVPFIRLMPRPACDMDDCKPSCMTPGQKPYPLETLLDEQRENELRCWADAARATAKPLLIEFGTEVNGCWFPWNSKWNGGATPSKKNSNCFASQELFKATYRRIVDIFDEQGADNVTWFFHVDCSGYPDEPWNDIFGYYPGDDYVDWIGISCYGADEPGATWRSLEDALTPLLKKLEDPDSPISGDKPIALLEFAVTEGTGPDERKDEWISEAFDYLEQNKATFRAVSWWHETFGPIGAESEFRIDSSNDALLAYRRAVASSDFTHDLVFGAGTASTKSPPASCGKAPTKSGEKK